MSWNYRVVRRKHRLPNGDCAQITFDIHEAYYDEVGVADSITVNPIDPHGETLEELRADLGYMLRAFDFPVLDYDTCKEI